MQRASPKRLVRAVSVRCSTFALCLTLGSLTLAAQPVAAQPAEAASDPSRDASARALFEDGVSLAEKGEWASAEDRFRRALSLRASPVIAYNLASALMEQGKLIEASETLRKIEQDGKADATLQHSVQSMQVDLSRRIGRISVMLRGKLASDTVTLDGSALLDAQLGVEIPIDPGTHRLSLERAGKSLDEHYLEIAPGASEQVTLRAPAVPTPREVATTSAASTPPLMAAAAREVDSGPTSSAGPVTGRWWFWTGIGAVVVAAVVVGVVVAGSGGSKPAAAYQGDFTPASLRVQVAK
jgi:hypothetical protein